MVRRIGSNTDPDEPPASQARGWISSESSAMFQPRLGLHVGKKERKQSRARSRAIRRAEKRCLPRGRAPPEVQGFIDGRFELSDVSDAGKASLIAQKAAKWLVQAVPVSSTSPKLRNKTEQLLASPVFAGALEQPLVAGKEHPTLWDAVQCNMVEQINQVGRQLPHPSLARPYLSAELKYQENPTDATDHISAFPLRRGSLLADPESGQQQQRYGAAVKDELLAGAVLDSIRAKLAEIEEIVNQAIGVAQPGSGCGMMGCNVRRARSKGQPSVIQCTFSTTSALETRTLARKISAHLGEIVMARSLPQLLLPPHSAECFHGVDGSLTVRYSPGVTAAELARRDARVRKQWQETEEGRSLADDHTLVNQTVVIWVQPFRRASRSTHCDQAIINETRFAIRNSYIMAAAKCPAAVAKLASRGMLWGDPERMYVGGPRLPVHIVGRTRATALERGALQESVRSSESQGSARSSESFYSESELTIRSGRIGFKSLKRTNPLTAVDSDVLEFRQAADQATVGPDAAAPASPGAVESAELEMLQAKGSIPSPDVGRLPGKESIVDVASGECQIEVAPALTG